MKAEDFANVQRLVLHGSVWNVGRHLALEFPEYVPPRPPYKRPGPSHPLTFLATKRGDGTTLYRPTGAWPPKRPQVQLSIGISRRGLAALDVPAHVLSCFALKSPAFTAGAALRSSHQLGTSGRSAPPHWDESFQHMKLDAVLSLHGEADDLIDEAIEGIEKAARQHDVVVRQLPATRRLDNPAGAAKAANKADKPDGGDRREQWTHFGFRDGLARVGVRGWTEQKQLDECRPFSIHAPGEFVLGYPQDSGANPYIAGPGPRVWPDEVRAFFRDGSFGVLHQMEQNVEAFDAFVAKAARDLEMSKEELKAKLCGRYPDGRVLSGAQAPGPVDADFDFANDTKGRHCPFGSHIRRMNPRAAVDAEGALAHAARSRALLRRGMPYVRDDGSNERGFVGHFFCASIEDQFEHLVGQWGERVPLGSADRGRARDPLIGAHEYDDGDFEIPTNNPKASLTVKGLEPFVRVVGTSYLFYPSLSTFDGIVASEAWFHDDDEADA
jgi:deferrochelatase/peroxidase EfeB